MGLAEGKPTADDVAGSAIKSMDKLYEFEREPVSEDKLQSGKHFAGVFAGEHVAGTEFVIGALFVAWGATAKDIFLGLLLGNLLAVLTWTFVCAPIAVQTRLTLYWYLRKIAGPVTTTIYNVLNAMLFCILAGCMITVSASAVRVPFGIPEQTGWFPTDIRFVIVVLCVGAVVVTLAILGFKKLAQFAEVCSPWLFLMFIAGAFAMLPALSKEELGGQMGSLAQFWELANQSIWTGQAPEGQSPIGFWHVAAFAWICNLAMHGGLSDMALLRYAKRASYGLYSAFGMFLGHYLAWICAGIMGATTAVLFQTTMDQLDAGAVASQALGAAGIVAVIIAGWTTSNPTLYRAGLAFQAVTPGWPRWLVTLVAGAVTTVIACSPFVFTKLLDFVGWYGLLLMPVGAIVFVEHWIFPKIGFTQFWASKKKLAFSWPALASWAIAIAAALLAVKFDILHLFFLFVPIWLLTAVLYIAFASVAGAREKLPQEAEAESENKGNEQEFRSAAEEYNFPPPKKPADVLMWASAVIAVLCLAVCLIWPLWIFFGSGADYDDQVASFKRLLIVPSVIYFIAGTIWMVRRNKAKE